MLNQFRALIVGWSLSCVLSGCGNSGPELAGVDGTVTLDGQPLPFATVEFYPEHGRPSVGFTDDGGRYTLRFSKSADGALLGSHTVTVSTLREKGQFTDGDGKPVAGSGETIAARYNREARDNPEMRVEVKAGGNTIDLALKSE